MDPTHHHVPEAPVDEPLQDPVCGMAVTSSSPHHHAYHGRHFYFCNPKCLDKFRADPARYLNPAPALADTPQPAVEGAEYTCPMHPEIR
ncbi:MAG: YHS domain-containing protein, partial [Moraxellaceae bacterium]|nr:YHS domain-containing protein [Moraxellaceae bacterium]